MPVRRSVVVVVLLVLSLARCACPVSVGTPDGGVGSDGDDAGVDDDADAGFADGGPCASADDCQNDTFCTPGGCVPFGDGDADDSCTTGITIDALIPQVQCAFTEPPAGDPNPAHNQVMSTPVVVDLDLDDNPGTLRPSIVFVTFSVADNYHGPGVLRVIDGGNCQQQLSAPSVLAMSPAGPAVGDITGDGRPDIVVAADDPAQPGGVVALQVDTSGGAPALNVLWRSADCTGGVRAPDATGGRDRWPGPSLFDIDDDGAPEVLYGATVYNGADGCLRSPSSFPAYSVGVVAVAVDVDEDGLVELVLGDALLEWSPATSSWQPDALFQNGGGAAGQVAVADFGTFPIAGLGGADVAEIAVVSSGNVRVQTVDGTVVFGPFPIAGGGTGGAPTAADFDGDGRVEVAAAAAAAYAVYDLDCVPGGDPAGCASGRTDGVLWQQPVQDLSSNVTGSSIFDFDANGSAEVVYADECFLRVFEGISGRVLYSSARSSGTTYENPVIADVDGDFKTEIVTSANDYAALGCPAEDPLLPGTPHVTSHGILVLRDAEDRWAASRPVWNQHAYFVTHVDDHGVIPRTSAQLTNWREPGLNNFRQNVQGGLDATGAGDLTSLGGDNPIVCDGELGSYVARVCNRGTLPIGAGAVVAFQGADGAELCRATTTATLDVGACLDATCSGPAPAGPSDITVVVDPDSNQRECHEGNNRAFIPGLTCLQIGG